MEKLCSSIKFGSKLPISFCRSEGEDPSIGNVHCACTQTRPRRETNRGVDDSVLQQEKGNSLDDGSCRANLSSASFGQVCVASIIVTSPFIADLHCGLCGVFASRICCSSSNPKHSLTRTLAPRLLDTSFNLHIKSYVINCQRWPKHC